MAEPARGGTNPILRFFGLDTAERAGETCLWVLPYLGAFLFALVVLSVLIQRFFPLPMWIHGLAVTLAAVNCFFFMARIRIMALDDADAVRADEVDDSDPG